MSKYRLVVTKKALGLYWSVRLMVNDKIVMHSENYFSKGNAVRSGETLSQALLIPLEIQS